MADKTHKEHIVHNTMRPPPQFVDLSIHHRHLTDSGGTTLSDDKPCCSEMTVVVHHS